MSRLRLLLLVPLLVLVAPGWGWAATGTDDVVRALRADPVFAMRLCKLAHERIRRFPQHAESVFPSFLKRIHEFVLRYAQDDL